MTEIRSLTLREVRCFAGEVSGEPETSPDAGACCSSRRFPEQPPSARARGARVLYAAAAAEVGFRHRAVLPALSEPSR